MFWTALSLVFWLCVIGIAAAIVLTPIMWVLMKTNDMSIRRQQRAARKLYEEHFKAGIVPGQDRFQRSQPPSAG